MPSPLIEYSSAGRLDYEPRGYAQAGSTVFIGTKSGVLYSVELGDRGSDIKPLARFDGRAIRATWAGGPGSASPWVAGLEDGCVVFGLPHPDPVNGYRAVQLEERPVRDLTHTGQSIWALQDGRITAVTTEGAGRHVHLEHPASWLFGVEDTLVVVCEDGVIAVIDTGVDKPVASLVRGGSDPAHSHPTRLRFAPTDVVQVELEEASVALALLVTHEHGLDYIALHRTEDGWHLRTQATIFSGRVTAARPAWFYGERSLVVAARGGKLFSVGLPFGATSDPADESSPHGVWSPIRGRWRRWPTLASDVRLIAFDPTGEQNGNGHGLVVLGTHEIVRVQGRDVRVREPLRDALKQFKMELTSDPDTFRPLDRRHAARGLRRRLLRAAAQPEATAETRSKCVAAARHLGKYAIEINSFFAKDLQLSRLADQNQKRHLDRLIYQARLATRRFDRLDSLAIDSRVFCIGVDATKGRVVIGRTVDKAAKLDLVGWDQARDCFSDLGDQDQLTISAGKRPSVFATVPAALDEGALHCWAQGDKSGEDATQDGIHLHATGEDERVFAALRSRNNTFLGLGRHRLRTPDGARHRLTPPHTGPSPSVGSLRVRVLLQVGDDDQDSRIYCGSEAGGIYLLEGSEPGETGALVWTSRLVGTVNSPIWCGVVVDDRHLAFGTAGGDVMFFQVVQEQAASQTGGLEGAPRSEPGDLRLKARDSLFHLVGAMFLVGEGDSRRVLAVCVNGSVGVYHARIGHEAPLQRTHPFRKPFLGMRAGHVRAAPGGVTAAAVMKPDTGPILLLAYDHPAGGHRLDAVRLIDMPTLPSEGAFDQGWRGNKPEEASRATVLRSIPGPSPCLRAMAARIQMESMVLPTSEQSPGAEDELDRMLRASLVHYPSTRAEFKAILDGVRGRMSPYWIDGSTEEQRNDAQAWYREASSRVDQLSGWRGDPKLKAAVARKLFCPAVFQAGGDQQKISAWIEKMVEDPSPLVRLESLQAIADTLWLIRSGGDALKQRCFSGPDEIGPILRPVASYLAARPPADTRPETASATSWTATIIIRHLMAIFPDAIWSIADHLVVAGVRRNGLLLMRKTLPPADRETSGGLAEVARRLDLYSPGEVDAPAAVRFLHQALNAEAGAEGSPDCEFQRARRPYYQWMLDGFAAGTTEQIKAAIDRGARIDDSTVVRRWQGGRDDPKPHLFAYLGGWLKGLPPATRATAAPTEPNSPEELATKLRELADGLDASERGEGTALVFDPESSLLPALFRTWVAALVRPMPLPDDVVVAPWIDDTVTRDAVSPEAYRVTGPRQDKGIRSAWVVDGERLGVPGAEAATAVKIRTRPVSGDLAVRSEMRRDIVKQWSTIQGLRDCSLPTIRHIVEREWGVTMVMDNEGRPVPWGSARRTGTSREGGDRPLAEEEVRRLVQMIGGRALVALHRAGLWHGDVSADNIVQRTVDSTPVYTLVDFGHSGPLPTQSTITEVAPTPYPNENFAWWRHRREPQGQTKTRTRARAQQGDVLKFCALTSALIPKVPRNRTEGLVRAVHIGDVGGLYLALRGGTHAPPTQGATDDPQVTAFERLVERHLLAPVAGKLRVFVSYTRLDPWSRRFVGHLAPFMELPGTDVFVDEATSPAADWKAEIESRLVAADIVVACVSSHWLQRPYIEEVEQRIIRLRREDARMLVIPVAPVANPARLAEIFGCTQCLWPLDAWPDPTDADNTHATIQTALTALVQLIADMGGQER